MPIQMPTLSLSAGLSKVGVVSLEFPAVLFQVEEFSGTVVARIEDKSTGFTYKRETFCAKPPQLVVLSPRQGELQKEEGRECRVWGRVEIPIQSRPLAIVKY